MIRRAAVWIILLLTTGVSAAEAEKDAAEKKAFGIAPFPIIAYMPETSIMFGAGSVFYHQPQDKGKIDSIEVLAYYTLKNQFEILSDGSFYFAEDRFLLKTKISAARYPYDFYGIGADTPKSNRMKYTPIYYPAKLSFLIKCMQGLYIGPVYEYRHNKILSVETGKSFSNDVIGNMHTDSSGAGIHLLLDSTEGGLNPVSGFSAKINYMRYSKELGGDNNFQTGECDLRGYIPLKTAVIGIQGVYKRADGDTPFFYIPSVGGNRILRGILNNRYIDTNTAAAQTELRFPIYSRFGGTVFCGAGEAADSADKFGKNIRAAGGFGFRFMIDKAQKINIRADAAYNGKEILSYVNIMEAF